MSPRRCLPTSLHQWAVWSTSAGSAAARDHRAEAGKASNGSVIIRRGDLLSRHFPSGFTGVACAIRTIYLANQQQIRDPDLIMPGQVFRVPSKSDHGEAADMTKLGEQATTTPTAE